MRILLTALLSLTLLQPCSRALAYDGEEYEGQNEGQYQDQGVTYEEGTYPEETYPEESYPEESYPEESYPEGAEQDQPYQEEPAQDADTESGYQEPATADHQQEIRQMCQQYARDMAPDEQASYVDDCMRSQGY